MHEDLNRILTKPYIVEKDFVTGDSEEDYYNICKSNFLARNSSRIQEIFYGKFRTAMSCPDCKHVSLKFEEFSMLSIPIKSLQKTSSTIIFYYLSELSIYDMTRVEYTGPKDQTLATMKLRFCAKVDIDSTECDLYYFQKTGDKASFIRVGQLDTKLKDVVLSSDSFFFMVFDRPETLEGKDPLTIFYEIKGVTKSDVVGMVKPVLCSKSVEVRNLYKFFYDCVHSICSNRMKEFDLDFATNSTTRPFDLYRGRDLLTLDIDSPTTVTLKNNDTILVNFLVPEIKKDRRLNSLPPELSMKIFDCQPGLFDCLDAMTNAEELDEENKWFCEKCKDHKKANIQMKIKELPPILIIHLKRLRRGTKGLVKISDKVDFPLRDLNLSKFTTDASDPVNHRPYHLFGVVSHFGQAYSGHYTSQVLSGDTWTECNDNAVSLSIPGSTQAETAYILFYRREP